MLLARKQQIAICRSGAFAILCFALVPALLIVWRHARFLISQWDWSYLVSPSLYVCGVVCWMALLTPFLSMFKLLMLETADDATWKVLGTLCAGTLLMGIGGTLFWLWCAWLSYPLLKDGQLRLVPLYPWPDSAFFGEFLRLF